MADDKWLAPILMEFLCLPISRRPVTYPNKQQKNCNKAKRQLAIAGKRFKTNGNLCK
jgi:hypothetical protein